MRIETDWQQEEWLKCAQSFEYFAANYIEIRTLDKGPVKFKLYDFQKKVLQKWQGHQFNILRKFRQGGLTTMGVLWSLWMCMFRTDKQILVMSKTDLEAIKAGKIAHNALDAIDRDNPWLFPNLSTCSKHVLSFADTKSEIEFGSVKRARGQSLNYVIIDEAAFIPEMDDAWAAMYPTVAAGGNVLVISTVNGIGNWYEEIFTDAQAGRNHFNVIDLHYTEHPNYRDPEWAKMTRANLGEKKWAQEFECSFLGSGETYLSSEILTRLNRQASENPATNKLFPEWDTDTRLFELHAKSDKPEDHEWQKGALWVWEHPQEGQEYLIGVDVAEGVGEDGDNSAFHIINMSNMSQAAEFSSNTIPPHALAMVLAQLGMYYNTALIAVENAGAGIAILDKLIHTLYYDNIYYHRIKTQEKAGVTVSRTTRPIVLESMQDYLQNNIATVNSVRLVRELRTFIFNRSTKRAEAQTGKHDDLVMSYAIALYVRDKSMRDVPLGVAVPDNVTDSHTSRLFEEIRKEIDRIRPEDLIAKTDEEKEAWEHNEVLPGVIMPFERPHDSLLKEFGW